MPDTTPSRGNYWQPLHTSAAHSAVRSAAAPVPRQAIAPDGQVIALGVTGLLNAHNFVAANQLGWNQRTLQFWPLLKFGVSSSPIIDGDRVMVMVGGTG